MENEPNNEFHFSYKNYFLRFQNNETDNSSTSSTNRTTKHIRHALEYFVDDLKIDQNKTIDRFLSEQTADDIFLFIAQLLLCDDDRICGNCAYIIGSTLETENGLKKFLSVFTNDCTLKTVDIINLLCQMLTHSDPDCVLNASGTLGTISGSKEGRDFLLKHVSISQMILSTSTLLNSSNPWIASNAALVIARLTVEENGCQIILNHSNHDEILNHLLSALDIDDPSRSTNIAFAIARLIESESGKRILINACGKDKFFEALLIMLKINEDKGINKNACYALSCLCTSQYGYQLCLESMKLFYQIIVAIETILLSIEHETVWFALMCLTTIAKYDGACEHLCYSKKLPGIIEQIQEKWIHYKDIQDESKLLWFMINRNNKPNPPIVNECQSTSVDISWNAYIPNDNTIQYRVILDELPIATTTKTHYSICDLKPNTDHNVQIQFITVHGESLVSDPTPFHTEDELPPPVVNLHVVRTTTTVIRIAWEAPDLSGCNGFKGYQIYLNDAEHDFTESCELTINLLIPNTPYQINVCAVSLKGHGAPTLLNVKTESAGDCNPAPPTFPVIGRRELHIKWNPPEVIYGRFSRYELICNGRSIYSGTDQEYHATKLKSDTEYTMEVCLITNEGRFRSRPVKTRTLKDEFQLTNRQSLYERPTHVPVKFRRSDTVTGRKVSPNVERRVAKEMPVINQNVQITTIRSVQLKSEIPSYSRALPGLFRASPTRPMRAFPRSKTDLAFQQLSAAVIIPTLSISHPTHVSHGNRARAFRYPIFTKSYDRASSVSINDSNYSIRRYS